MQFANPPWYMLIVRNKQKVTQTCLLSFQVSEIDQAGDHGQRLYEELGVCPDQRDCRLHASSGIRQRLCYHQRGGRRILSFRHGRSVIGLKWRERV